MIYENLANLILFNIQHHSLDEIVRLRLIGRRTKDNYSKVLEKLGIGEYTVSDQSFNFNEGKVTTLLSNPRESNNTDSQ